jgi:hypothetical protein
VLLSNTANDVLTHCTTWVAPTARLGSGGAEFTVKAPAGPAKPRPTPRKVVGLLAETNGLTVVCTAVSGPPARTPPGNGRPKNFSWGAALSTLGGIWRSGGETSKWSAWETSGLSWAAAVNARTEVARNRRVDLDIRNRSFLGYSRDPTTNCWASMDRWPLRVT